MKILIKNNCDEILKSLIIDYWRMDGLYFTNSLEVLSKKYLVKKYEIEELIATYSVLEIRLPCLECHKIKRINITNRLEFRTTLVCRVCNMKKKHELFQQRKVDKNLKESVENDIKETITFDTFHILDNGNDILNPYKKNTCIGLLPNDFKVNFFTNYYCKLYLMSI